MLVWMLNNFLYFNKDGSVIYLDEKKIYKIPDEWGILLVKNWEACEYIKIKK